MQLLWKATRKIPTTPAQLTFISPRPCGTGDLRKQTVNAAERDHPHHHRTAPPAALPARQHMHWNKEKPPQHRCFIKAWFAAKLLQRGHRAPRFRAALLNARQQQTHAQPWSCWQLVAISLLGQISPRCWGWKRVLQSPAPTSTSKDWGPAYLPGSLSASQGVFLERFPTACRAVHLSQAKSALQADLCCQGQERA